MSTPNYPPRFCVGEDVRLHDALQQVSGSNRIPAGTLGYVSALEPSGAYHVKLTGHYSGYAVVATESQLEEAGIPERKPTLDVGAVVQGKVARIAMRQGGVLSVLLTLDDRHELFVVHAQNFDQEYTMLMTRPGDKVRFVITESDDQRPRGNAFANFHLS